VLLDETSPQFRAFYWLANLDIVKVPIMQKDRVIQRYILALLYYSTGGPTTWHLKGHFLTDRHECEWAEFVDGYGNIGAGDCGADGQVTHLQFYKNGLIGTIPSELGHLSSLSIIAFGGNSLVGTIPPSLAQLTNLRQLGLQDNNFSGNLPKELAKLPYIERISLYGNYNLTGDINFLCPSVEVGPLSLLVANCAGKTPEVICDCCTSCCNQETDICCKNDGSNDCRGGK